MVREKKNREKAKCPLCHKDLKEFVNFKNFPFCCLEHKEIFFNKKDLVV